MREGITQLAEKFPALRRTDKGTLSRSLAEKSESGTLRLDFRFPSLTTEGPPIDAPTETKHRVTVALSPPTPGQAGPYGLTRYGRLGLYGDVIVFAGDPALQTALTRLVREELAPLAELDGTAIPMEMGEDYTSFATLEPPDPNCRVIVTTATAAQCARRFARRACGYRTPASRNAHFSPACFAGARFAKPLHTLDRSAAKEST